MVNTAVGDLRNSGARPDEINYDFKKFSNELSIIETVSEIQDVNTLTGYFLIGVSAYYGETDGIQNDLMLGNSEESPDVLLDNLIYNSNNKIILPLTTNSLFEDCDWVFNYDTGELTIGVENLISRQLVLNTDIDYTTATITIRNVNQDIIDNCNIYLITDSEEIEIHNGVTYTFSITNTFKIKIIRKEDTTRNVFDGSLSFPIIFDIDEQTTISSDIFTNIGKPMIIEIQYN